jgi:hypothetical protein
VYVPFNVTVESLVRATAPTETANMQRIAAMITTVKRSFFFIIPPKYCENIAL